MSVNKTDTPLVYTVLFWKAPQEAITCTTENKRDKKKMQRKKDEKEESMPWGIAYVSW